MFAAAHKNLIVFVTVLVLTGIAGGAHALDCNENGIPDECDLDCGVSEGPCHLPDCGLSADCDDNGVPDECEVHCQTDGDCADELFCNGAETCLAACMCQPGDDPCDDGVGCTDDSCNEGTDSCDNIANDANCDNGLYCDGAETCHATLGCQPGDDPCPEQLCDEGGDICVDCVDDGDCVDDNPCTDDACVDDRCEYTNNTDACDDDDPCTEGDQCDYGWCVGAHVANCCQVDADCDDFRDCTVDACTAEICTNTPLPEDTPCGNPDEDACTDPDTCDGSGTCWPNDADDGMPCPGGECLAGMCEPVTYDFVALTEGNNIGSEPRGGTCHDGHLFVVGRVIDDSLVDHAAAWHSTDGETWDLALLSGPSPSVATEVDCEEEGNLCIVVGFAGAPAQPVAWVNGGGGWVLEYLPLLGGSGGSVASILAGCDPAEEVIFNAVGYIVGPDWSTAMLWERDAFGVWTGSPLPDFGEWLDSEASSIVVCDEGLPEVCQEGELLIGGWHQNMLAKTRPALWVESDPQSRDFGRYDVPLPPGAVDGELNAIGFTDIPTVVDALVAVGTVTTNSGDTIGMLWTTEDLENWTTTALPPLPGFDSSKGFVDSGPREGQIHAVGTSYDTGEDPLRSGIATEWHFTYQGELRAVTDLNPVTIGVPEDAVLTSYDPNLGDYGMPIPDGGGGCAGVAIFTVSPPSSRGTPLPHAGVLTPVPQAPAIPAVSAWGLAASALLVLVFGTLVFAHRRRLSRPI